MSQSINGDSYAGLFKVFIKLLLVTQRVRYQRTKSIPVNAIVRVAPKQETHYKGQNSTSKSHLAIAETNRMATGALQAVQNTTKASLTMGNVLKYHSQLSSSSRFVCFLVVDVLC